MERRQNKKESIRKKIVRTVQHGFKSFIDEPHVHSPRNLVAKNKASQKETGGERERGGEVNRQGE